MSNSCDYGEYGFFLCTSDFVRIGGAVDYGETSHFSLRLSKTNCKDLLEDSMINCSFEFKKKSV